MLQLRHGVARHRDVGLSLASKPDNSNRPVGGQINPTTNYNHLSPETVQIMFSVFSKAPLIHGLLLKEMIFDRYGYSIRQWEGS